MVKKATPRMELEVEVRGGRKDFGRWMREREPKGIRGGTADFRKNVTVIREQAGRLAAEEDRRRLGDVEMERRMADCSAGLDVGQLAAQLQDKYAVLQDLHATSADLGWSSSVLHGVPQ